MKLIKDVIWKCIINFLGRVNWTGFKYFFSHKEYDLTDEQIDDVVKKLQVDRLIILTRKNSHLSTYMTGLADYLLQWRSKVTRPKFGKWSHVLFHVEQGLDLDVIESVGRGVQRVSYFRAFNVDEICLLKPKYLSEEGMELANKIAQSYIGYAYDTSFDLKNDNKLSCVELIYRSMMAVDNTCLPGLNMLIKRYKNLTPQMFYDSRDFEIVLELKGNAK